MTVLVLARNFDPTYLTDIKLGLNAGNLVRLTRTGPHRAEGRFDAGQAAFMSLRHTPGAGARVPYTRAPHDNPITEHTTTLDPRTPWTNPVVWFLTALRIGPHYRMGYTGGDPRHCPDAVCLRQRGPGRIRPGLNAKRVGPGQRCWLAVDHG
jgi:hypothetical protein